METFVIKRGSTVLADGQLTGAIVVEGPNLNGQRMLDVEPFIFGGRIAVYDRAGDSDICTFIIARLHASPTDALDHVLRHGRATRGVADLVIQLTDGAVTTVWKALAAGWRSNEVPAPQGYSSAVQYTVVCPAFEAPETIEGPVPDGNELLGDLDGGNDDLGVEPADDWNCLSETDDDGAVVAALDGLEDAA